MLGKWRIQWLFDREVPVEVSEKDGMRYLHLGSSTVQSAMKVADPVELVLSYTRAMMGFLLFCSQPRHAVMVGLGGGSLTKFLYHRMTGTRITVIENNAKVIQVARQCFVVPEDDERLQVELGDGQAWVAAHTQSCDVLMVDGYDGHSQVETLSTEDFYAAARGALDPAGILVVNLWSSDRRFDSYLQRIERCFEALALVPAERRGNVIALGFCCKPREARWSRLRAHAARLERRYGLEFGKILDGLRELNPHDDKGLRF
ncbi:MAG: polyamine aminopropyltransferase [Burkholderiales bacterium]